MRNNPDGDDMQVQGWDGADVLVEILQRVTPPSCWRRLRLVCRHWRDVIDERLPAPETTQARVKVLALARGHVYVDQVTTENGEQLDLLCDGGQELDPGVSVVGTCNGLICLHRARGGGDIVLVNPVTGEFMCVPPPLPYPRLCHGSAYSFAHDPATGLYKIVHVPARYPGGGAFDKVNVLTLGATSWTLVPAPPRSSCCLLSGSGCSLASVGGATYWVTQDGARAMSLDLTGERVTFVKEKLPVAIATLTLALGYTRRLADVGGRLGLVVGGGPSYGEVGSKIDVWVLDGGGGCQAWVRRYTLLANAPTVSLASPHFAHGGRILTTTDGTAAVDLRAHLPSEGWGLECGVVRVADRNPAAGTLLRRLPRRVGDDGVRTFAYVKTREPLLGYIAPGPGGRKVQSDKGWRWSFDRTHNAWDVIHDQ